MQRVGLTSQPLRWSFDVMVAAALLTVSLGTLLGPISLPGGGQGLLALTMIVGHSGVLVLRRVRPLEVLAVNLVSGLVVVALIGMPTVVLGPSPLVAVYTAASLVGTRRAAVATVAAAAASVVAAVGAPDPPDPTTVLGNLAMIAVAWFLGSTVRSRREYVVNLEARTLELGQARHELAEAAAMEERLRIARELHDILAHSLGTIVVQSGAGAHVIEREPEEAKKVLQAIERTSRDALGEIRRAVGALRDGTFADRSPLPGLSDLAELVERSRLGGIAARLEMSDVPDDVDAGLQLAAYRIVQEALANVVRHSGATSARVSVAGEPGGLRIEVVDDGKGMPPDTAGHGVTGMRERAAALGGTFEVGLRPEGGLRVSARLPSRERR